MIRIEENLDGLIRAMTRETLQWATLRANWVSSSPTEERPVNSRSLTKVEHARQELDMDVIDSIA